MKKMTILACVALMSVLGFADDCELWPTNGFHGSDGKIVLGEWNSNFNECLDYAKANNHPLLVFWANPGCPHCDELEREMCEPDFVTWRKRQQLVMAFGYGKCSQEQKDAKKFAENGELTYYPFIRVYWPKENGEVVSRAFTGMKNSMPVKEGDNLRTRLMKSVESILVDYTPPYMGGRFLVGTTVGERLEAQVGYTKYVDVPLVRDGGSGKPAASNVVAWACGGSNSLATVEWKAGDAAKTMRVPIDPRAKVGEQIDLSILFDDGSARETSIIAVVDREISPKNPVWIGERTADELAWGEWTADLDVAQEKVRAWNAKHEQSERAYTLVLVGGSRWCPDCARTDAYFVDTDAFKTWATETHKIACVAIDIPTDPSVGGPCMFTHDVKEVSAKYIEADPDKGPRQSGSGYLSRWMVGDEAAKEIYDRNTALVGRNTLNGGWNRPERANQLRTGVPIFIMLKDDGTIAGRIETFANTSPSDENYLAGNLLRFEELLATVDKPDGEANFHPSTATAKIDAKAGLGAVELTGADTAMTFEVTNVEPYATLTVTAKGATTLELANKLSIWSKVGAKTQELVGKTAQLSPSGVAVTAELSDPSAKYYARLEVAGLGDLAVFGQNERISTEAQLDCALTYKSGTVAFAQSAQTVFVPDGKGSVTVKRIGGVYGKAAARIFVSEAGSATDCYTFTEQDLIWESGDAADKTVEFSLSRGEDLASGAFKLALEKLPASLADVSAGQHEVTLTDTKDPCLDEFAPTVSAWSLFNAEEAFELRNVDTAKSVSIKKLDGALPSGVKLAYDRKTGTVKLTGTPKTSGTYTYTFAITQNRVTGLPSTLTVTVADPTATNPYTNRARAQQQIALLTEFDGRLIPAGLLTLKVTAKNKITAKYQGSESSSVSFSGTWTELDADGAAVTTLTSKKGAVLSLKMDKAGAIEAVLTVPSAMTAFATGDTQLLTGSAVYPSTAYASWSGYYTVTFVDGDMSVKKSEPSGTGYAVLTVKDNGKVSWKGVLPNGQAVSGTAYLTGDYEDEEGDRVAECVLYKRSSKNVFLSVLALKANRERWDDDAYAQMIHNAEGLKSVVLHRESSFDYLMYLDAYGGWYEKNISPAELCATFGYDASNIVLSFDMSALADSERYGAVLPISDSVLSADERKFEIMSGAERLKFTFSKATGIFSGSIPVQFAEKRLNAKFKGVILSGWSGCAACSGRTLVERPFASGQLTFKDYVNGRGVTRSIPVNLEVRAAVE